MESDLLRQVMERLERIEQRLDKLSEGPQEAVEPEEPAKPRETQATPATHDQRPKDRETIEPPPLQAYLKPFVAPPPEEIPETPSGKQEVPKRSYRDVRREPLEFLARPYDEEEEDRDPTRPRMVPPEPKREAVKSDQSNLFDELQFGRNLLPIIGGISFLIGIALLVAYAVVQGWITPAIQYGFAFSLCITSIVIGIRLQGDHRHLGQVLTALGSGGLYLVTAGGHFYQNFYSANVVVAAFVVLGLLNLGYGSTKGSQTFFGIGLLGGLIGSLFPFAEGHYALHTALHLLILLPAAGIAIRHRWAIAWGLSSVLAVLLAGAVLWTANTFSVREAGLFSAENVVLLVGTVLITAGAWRWICNWKRPSLEAYVTVPSLAMVAGLAYVFALPALAWLHVGVLFLAGSFMLMSLVLPRALTSARQEFMAIGYLALVIAGPFGNNLIFTATALAVGAFLSAGIAWKVSSKFLALVAGLLILIGAIVISGTGIHDAFGTPIAEDFRFLGIDGVHLGWALLALACVVVPVILGQLFTKGAAVIALLFYSPVIILGFAALGGKALTTDRYIWNIGILLVSVILLVYGLVTRFRPAFATAYFLQLITAFLFWTSLETQDFSPQYPYILATLLVLFVLTYVACRTYWEEPELELVRYSFGLIAGAYLARIAFHALIAIPVIPATHAGALAVLLWLTAVILIGLRLRFTSSLALAYTVGFFQLFAHAFMAEQWVVEAQRGERYLEFGIWIAYVLLLFPLGKLARRTGLGPNVAYPLVTATGVLPCFGLFAFTFGVLLNWAELSELVTFGLTIYATVALTVGFLLREQNTRYVGLSLFTIVVAKLVMVDFISLEPLPRIFAFMGLGLALILAGFGYVWLTRLETARLADEAPTSDAAEPPADSPMSS